MGFLLPNPLPAANGGWGSDLSVVPTPTNPTAAPNTSGSITSVTTLYSLLIGKRFEFEGSCVVSGTSSPVGPLWIPLPYAPLIVGNCNAYNNTSLIRLDGRLQASNTKLLIYGALGADPAYGNYTYTFNGRFWIA